MSSYESDSTQLLNELQALDYALVELTIFLSANPYDENAIRQHKELVERRHATRNLLENHTEEFSSPEASESKERWSLSPWPWQL